jgi:hypothetical protein
MADKATFLENCESGNESEHSGFTLAGYTSLDDEISDSDMISVEEAKNRVNAQHAADERVFRKVQTPFSKGSFSSKSSTANFGKVFTAKLTDIIGQRLLNVFVCGIGKNVKGCISLLVAIHTELDESNGDGIAFFVVDKCPERIKSFNAEVKILCLDTLLPPFITFTQCTDIVFPAADEKILESCPRPIDVMVTFCRGLPNIFYLKMMAISLITGISSFVAPMVSVSNLKLKAAGILLKAANFKDDGLISFSEFCKITPDRPEESFVKGTRNLGLLDFRYACFDSLLCLPDLSVFSFVWLPNARMFVFIIAQFPLQ